MTDVYLSVRNALPMIPLSQVKVSYIPTFYQSPLKHFFIYYYLYDFQANFVSIWHLFVK